MNFLKFLFTYIVMALGPLGPLILGNCAYNQYTGNVHCWSWVFDYTWPLLVGWAIMSLIISEHLFLEGGSGLINKVKNKIKTWLVVRALWKIVKEECTSLAKLGEWPEWIPPESILNHIPKAGQTASGFDAGIACCLGMIPRNRQRLSAVMHAAITEQAVMQVRAEAETLDPDSETTWWLAACSVCQEGGVTQAQFMKQINEFRTLVENPEARVEAAHKMLKQMQGSFEMVNLDPELPWAKYALGDTDGCIHAAYFQGHQFGVCWAEKYEIYFIGTYEESLGLENFKWSDPDQKDHQGKSGPVNKSKQFVKCMDVDELEEALHVVFSKFDPGYDIPF